MQWLLLLLLVSATVVPVVLLWGFAGCSSFGTDGTGSTIPAPVSPMAAGTSESAITVSWTYPPPPATPSTTPPAPLPPTAFKVFRGIPGPGGTETGEILLFTSLFSAAPTFTDGSVEDEATVIYRIKASRSSGDSDFSALTSATSLPKAPTQLDAVAQGQNQINLSWTKNSKTTQFQIQHRSPPGVGDFTPLANVFAPQYAHAGLVQGSTHEYRVAAVVDGFTNHVAGPVLSLYSNVAQATTAGAPTADFATAFTAVIDTPQPGAVNYCLVQRLDHTVFSKSGTQIKITLKGPPPGTALTIDSLYISGVAPGGDPYDSPPAAASSGLVRLVDKGINGQALSVPPAGITVGPVPFNMNPPQDLLIAFDISGDAGSVVRNGSVTGATSYAKPNTKEAATADRSTGYTAAVGNLYLITKIEVAS